MTVLVEVKDLHKITGRKFYPARTLRALYFIEDEKPEERPVLSSLDQWYAAQDQDFQAHLNPLANKSSWYRVESREPKPTFEGHHFVPGDRVTFSTAIARTGYYVQHVDMPIALLNERLVEYWLNLANGALEKGLTDPFRMRQEIWHGNYPTSPTHFRNMTLIQPITHQMMLAMLSVMEGNLATNYAFSKLRYELRNQWIGEERERCHFYAPDIPLDLRTFWYCDLPKRLSGKILYKRIAQIGWRHDGHSYSYDWDDYDPPSFECLSSHWVFTVALDESYQYFTEKANRREVPNCLEVHSEDLAPYVEPPKGKEH